MTFRTPRGRGRLAAWCWLSLALLPAALHGQSLSGIDRERGRNMLRQVSEQIRDRYYDPTLRGVPLDARVASLDSAIQRATSLSEVFVAVAQLPLELGDSHTYFIPPPQTVTVNYGWDLRMVGDSAYVWRVEPGRDAERQGVRPGDRVLSVNGHAPTRGNAWQMAYLFRALRPQPGLRVVMRAPGGQPRQLDLAAEVRQRQRILNLVDPAGGDLHALIREGQNAERELRPRVVDAAPDVAVWRLPTFGVAPEQIRDGLRRARGKRALVLDLRGNGGGPVDHLVMLLDGLSRDSVRIGTWHERGRQRPVWSRGSAGAFTGELVVLVDSESASASEITARVVQLAGRGVVLGDRTAGAVTRGRYQSLAMGGASVVPFGVMVTDAALVMADGGRLEGAGVAPDQVILPGAAQLAAGEDPVLAAALGRVGVPLDAAAAGALLRDR